MAAVPIPADGHAAVADTIDEVGSTDLAIPFPQWADPILASVLAIAVAAEVGFDWLLVALVPWALVLGRIAGIDFRELRVPNRLLLPAVLAAVPLLAIAGLLSNDGVSLGRSAIGAGISLVLFGLLHLASPASLGMGDVKLAPYLGAHLALFSWPMWYRGMLYAFLLVSVAGVIAVIATRAGRRTALPFAPFMALGAVLAIISL